MRFLFDMKDKFLRFLKYRIPEPPNTGFFANAAIFATLLVYAIVVGIEASYGLLMNGILAESPTANRATLSLAGSLAIFIELFLGVIVGKLVNRFGARLVCLTGGALIAVGFFLCSLSRSFMIFSYSVVVGTGMSLAYCAASMEISNYFTTRKAFANGISGTGTGIGGAVIPFLVSSDMTTSFTVLAIVSAVAISLAAILYVPVNIEPVKVEITAAPLSPPAPSSPPGPVFVVDALSALATPALVGQSGVVASSASAQSSYENHGSLEERQLRPQELINNTSGSMESEPITAFGVMSMQNQSLSRSTGSLESLETSVSNGNKPTPPVVTEETETTGSNSAPFAVGPDDDVVKEADVVTSVVDIPSVSGTSLFLPLPVPSTSTAADNIIASDVPELVSSANPSSTTILIAPTPSSTLLAPAVVPILPVNLGGHEVVVGSHPVLPDGRSMTRTPLSVYSIAGGNASAGSIIPQLSLKSSTLSQLLRESRRGRGESGNGFAVLQTNSPSLEPAPASSIVSSSASAQTGESLPNQPFSLGATPTLSSQSGLQSVALSLGTPLVNASSVGIAMIPTISSGMDSESQPFARRAVFNQPVPTAPFSNSPGLNSRPPPVVGRRWRDLASDQNNEEMSVESGSQVMNSVFSSVNATMNALTSGIGSESVVSSSSLPITTTPFSHPASTPAAQSPSTTSAPVIIVTGVVPKQDGQQVLLVDPYSISEMEEHRQIFDKTRAPDAPPKGQRTCCRSFRPVDSELGTDLQEHSEGFSMYNRHVLKLLRFLQVLPHRLQRRKVALGVWGDRRFLLVASTMALLVSSVVIVETHLATFLTESGRDHSFVSTIHTLIGVFGIIGRGFFGVFTYYYDIDLVFMTQLLGVITGLAVAALPVYGAHDWYLYLFSFILGAVTTPIYGFATPILASSFGIQALPFAIGATYTFRAPLVLAAAPIAGVVRNAVGNYSDIWIVCGLLIILSALPMGLLRCECKKIPVTSEIVPAHSAPVVASTPPKLTSNDIGLSKD